VVRLFGAVTVECDGRRVSAGGPRQAAVLSVLALNVARPVSVDRLIDAVWSDDPPNSVTNVLQVYVSALRKLLRPAGLSIERAGSTYVLGGSLDDIDVELFHRDAAEGRSALRAIEPERALTSLERAWGLWDPTPFAGLDDCAFVGAARASLLSSGLSVALDRGDALCALGRSAEAAAAAEQLVETHPFFEPAWELLMRALFYSGRQHDALTAFSRARAMFVEELGLDPPLTLAALERQILDRSLEPIATRAETVPPIVETADSPAPPRLPEPPSGMIGRTTEIDRIIELLGGDARLITLVGLGGIGKTTTALAVGQRLLAAGKAVVFADLAAAVEATSAMERMCEAASVGAGPDAATSLAEADPDLVLIADNSEQIADFAGAVATLLSATSRLELIVTSRVALRIRAEHVMPIRPLETSSDAGAADAGLLFVDRARRFRADIDLAGHEDAIEEICELAGGIPLAIEVAAGRLGHLTPVALLDRLRRQSAALLDGRGAVDLPDRQHNLRTVLDATSTLLTDGGAALARGLCVVKGSISLGLIEETFGDEPDLMDHLDELVDASLVNGPDHAGRYRMPIPVSEYFTGAEEVDGNGERILRAVLSVAEPLVSKVDQRGRWAEGSLLDDAAAVTVACDVAIAQCDAETGARLAVALRRYWLLGSRIGEALQFCASVLDLGPVGIARAHVELILGQFAAIVNRPDAATLLSGAIELAENTSGVDPHLLINSWCYLGSWRCDHGDLDGARDAAARVEGLARESTDQAVIGLSRDFGAYVAARVGDFETAVRLGVESLTHARLGGDRYVVIDLLNRIAENLLELGRLEEADSLVDEAMEIARTTPIGPLAAKVIQIQAAVDIEHGRLSTAIGAALEALRLTATSYPDPVTQASVLRILAAAWCEAGDLDAAARCDGAATGILHSAGAPAESASFGPSERRLGPMRRDGHAASAARIAAMDPIVVVDQLLARSSR
jgi:DNA-binding SARP family transcriptional activator/predicted ATPase